MRAYALCATAAAAGFIIATPATARDYGTLGTTWAISEPDLLTQIRARLRAAQESGALATMNHRFVEAASLSVQRPHPVERLTPATRDRLWEFDPTVTLAQDLRDAHGNLIAAQGQRFNPLTLVGMAHDFAFIDGDSDAELAWAMRQGGPDRLWIVFVKGSPSARMRQFQRRFWFDQQGLLTARFGIAHTPALITRSGDVLGVHEVALPASARP